MSRRTLIVRLAGAVVGIVAIAFAAATIDNPIETGGDGGLGDEGEGGGQPANQPTEGPISAVEVPAFLEYLLFLALVILAVVVVWYLINHRRRAVKLIAVFLVIALVGLAAVYGLSALDLQLGGGEPPEQPPPPPENESSGEPGTGDGDATVETNPLGSILLAIGAVAAIFVGALVLSRRETGPPDGEGAMADDDAESEQATAVAGAAGRAAERIESGESEDVDNEVYRAWRDMTRLLDVEHPESLTPGEFAEGAVEAGIAREDVTGLTRLFEDVRYGHRETTDVEERRAVEILRRIESEYGDDGESDEREGR